MSGYKANWEHQESHVACFARVKGKKPHEAPPHQTYQSVEVGDGPSLGQSGVEESILKSSNTKGQCYVKVQQGGVYVHVSQSMRF